MWWQKPKLKNPDKRSDLDQIRGRLTERVAELTIESGRLEELMKNMLEERAKDAKR